MNFCNVLAMCVYMSVRLCVRCKFFWGLRLASQMIKTDSDLCMQNFGRSERREKLTFHYDHKYIHLLCKLGL